MKKSLVFTLLLLVFCGCFSEPDPLLVGDVNQEFVISLNQNPTLVGSELQLDIKSINGFDCNEALVINDIIAANNILTLHIDRIDVPQTCNTGSYPAEGSSVLLLEQSAYNFVVRLGTEDFVSGRLYNDESQFQLEIADVIGVSFDKKSIHKIPQNHIWGSINIPNSSSLNAEEFKVRFQNFVQVSDQIKIGDYGLFQISDLQENDFGNDLEIFAVYSIRDIEGLRNLILETKAGFPEIEFDLQISTGEFL